MSSKNDGNFGRAALRHHIGLLCTTILRDPKPMPPFRLPRRVSNLLTHHGLMATPASRSHSAAPPRARAKLSARPPPAAGKQARLVSPGYLESCSVRSPEWCLIVVAFRITGWNPSVTLVISLTNIFLQRLRLQWKNLDVSYTVNI